jgi:integrase
MATIKKRSWKTGAGETKEAWQLRYVDGQGVRRSKQFERKGDASAYLTKAGWQISQGIHTADSASIGSISCRCSARKAVAKLTMPGVKAYT